MPEGAIGIAGPDAGRAQDTEPAPSIEDTEMTPTIAYFEDASGNRFDLALGDVTFERPAPAQSRVITEDMLGSFSVPLRVIDRGAPTGPTLADVLCDGLYPPTVEPPKQRVTMLVTGTKRKRTRIANVELKLKDCDLDLQSGEGFAHGVLEYRHSPWRLDPEKDKARRKAIAARQRIRRQKHGR